MARRGAYASLSLLLCLLFMIALSPVAAGEVSREEFEFVIEGELPVKEPAPETPPPASPSSPPSGSSSSGSGSSPSVSSPGPEPAPASSGDTSPSSAPTSQPTFTYNPQPFVRNYNFDDRRSDVPLSSTQGQFLMANVYGGSPNSSVLSSGIGGSLTSSTPSFTLVTNTPPQTSVANIVIAVLNTILKLKF